MKKTVTSKQLEPRYRSDLECQLASELEAKGIDPRYESVKLFYEKTRKTLKGSYKPDFVLPNGIFIEAKGWLRPDERQKYLDVRKHNPGLDLRFVFEKDPSKSRLSRTSKTTVAAWCEKHGFKYAEKHIPQEWIDE